MLHFMHEMSHEETVALILPVRNETRYIERCIQAILKQDYPQDKIEAIIVDGLSDDNTREIIDRYEKKFPITIKLLENHNKTVPYAMNIGIKKSVSKYIIRMDGHSEYPDDYVSKCIATLKRTGADNVGGLLVARGHGAVGKAFAKVLSSVFGVGNSGFRTKASSGYVDTVPFGAYQRTTFTKYGLYDERLTRRQDYELNNRIRKNGGRIYLDSNIELVYHCRSTISGILEQSYQKGKWNIITAKLCPGTLSIRHLVPLLFVLSLMVLPVLAFFIPSFIWILIGELSIYLLFNFAYSIKLADGFKEAILMIILFPLYHVAYGLGSFIGLGYNPKKALKQEL
ncbi:MAG TPA: glycosyltransferase [Candidatus Limnocylindrales bacterium]|nr:glycosyltransferase [Candidatus Limnocylindrales bacterium]